VTCALIAAIQATEVIKYIVGVDHLLANRFLMVDGLHTRVEEIELERTAGCEICSS
jgi:adenylyltransferase/sulfurtransferase